MGEWFLVSSNSIIPYPVRSYLFFITKNTVFIRFVVFCKRLKYEYMRKEKHEGGGIITDEKGKPIETRKYYYINKGGEGSHFNVRPIYNICTGKVKGTKEHYPLKKRRKKG